MIASLKQKKINLLTVFLIVFCFCGNAQSPEDLKAQMVKDWERAKAYTQEYLNAMPADKYSFKATDSVRSFAQQMIHLSQGTVFLVSTGSGMPPIFGERDIEHSVGAQSKDSVTYFANASYDYAINTIKGLDVSKFTETAKAFGMENQRWVWLMKAFEHQTHHRGQTTIYIRLAGLKPPGEKLF
ncbi:MAG: DinB family protein [Panacibacter sp.]